MTRPAVSPLARSLRAPCGMWRMTDQRGSTIAEIITALSMTGIIAMTASPAISTLRDQYELASATNQVAFEITRARMQAIGQGAFVRIRIVDGDLVRERSTNGVSYVQDGAAIKLPGKVTATAGTSGAPGFNRNGLAPTRTAITISNGCTQKTVQTNMVGRVTVS